MNRKFSQYIMPQVAIEQGATNVNGMTTYQGLLYKGNVPVQTVPMGYAYGQLLAFLSSFSNRIMLVAHNGSKYVSQGGLLGSVHSLRKDYFGFLSPPPYGIT